MNIAQQISEEEMQEGMSIKELLHILKVRLLWIIIAFVLVVSAAIGYLQYVTPMYESEVTMLVESLQNSSSFESLMLGQTTSKISTEVELALSRTNIETALTKLDLAQYTDVEGRSYVDRNVRGDVSKRTTVTTVKDTNIVRITVTDQNPQFARDFANALVESYNELLGTISRTSKTIQKEFIQSQLPINERQLQEAADALGAFREESNYIQLSDKSKLLSEKIAYFQLRREPLALQLREAELEIENYQETLASYAIQTPSFEELMRDVDIESLLVAYKENSRELIMYEAIQEGIPQNSDRLFVLRSAISQNTKKLLDRITLLVAPRGLSSDGYVMIAAQEMAKAYHQKIVTSAQVEILSQIEDTYTEELSQLPTLERQLLDLQRDVEVYETLRIRLMELLEEVKIAEASVAGNVTSIDPAEMRVNSEGEPVPVSPNKMLILAVSVLLGGALGVLLALMIEMLDVTIKDEAILRKLSGPNRPMLGWIPLMNFDKSLEIPSLVVYNDPLSFESERYKLIANNISFVTLNGHQRLFSITSPGMGEGKSSVAANIATSMAMNGLRVLLIDGDLRLPQLETFFNLKKSAKGLVDVVTTEISVEEVIVQPLANVSTLHLLPPGFSPPLPSAIFNSVEYVQMIGHLMTVYDYILIDTPPLVFASELMSIAKHVDGIAINIRAGVTTKGGLRELLDNLELADVNVLGIIFNGVIESKMGGHYSNGRYYSYQGSGYAKRYYSARYNTTEGEAKKAAQSTKVRNGYRANFLKDLKRREKSRNTGTRNAILPFMEKREPFENEDTKKSTLNPLASKAFREKEKKQDNPMDILAAIEHDPRAKGKSEE
ncbi:GumC family protein [Pleomorphochaeta sp. DL1XJH-081]|uniref:GumC family protein n=1 Tax=Pleomorphochaeta sp. DL1XJH-081 TaxID=3409690 RepID=UPI003BB54276